MPSMRHWPRSDLDCRARQPRRPMPWRAARRSPTTHRCARPWNCWLRARTCCHSAVSVCCCARLKCRLPRLIPAVQRASIWYCAGALRARPILRHGWIWPSGSRAPKKCRRRHPCSACARPNNGCWNCAARIVSAGGLRFGLRRSKRAPGRFADDGRASNSKRLRDSKNCSRRWPPVMTCLALSRGIPRSGSSAAPHAILRSRRKRECPPSGSAASFLTPGSTTTGFGWPAATMNDGRRPSFPWLCCQSDCSGNMASFPRARPRSWHRPSNCRAIGRSAQTNASSVTLISRRATRAAPVRCCRRVRRVSRCRRLFRNPTGAHFSRPRRYCNPRGTNWRRRMRAMNALTAWRP